MLIADQTTDQTRSSTAFDGEAFLYRPIPPLIPIGMAFVVISAAGSISEYLLIVPVIGIILSITGWRQIRQSQGTLSGGWLAILSLIIQAGMLVGFSAMHAYSYATEVRPGYQRVNFSAGISKKGFTKENMRLGIHPDVEKLIGQKVMIKGYMYPTKQLVGLKSFVLCRDNGDCCFGGQPKTTDMILVNMSGEKTVRFYDNSVLISVSGTFKAEPTVDETGLKPVYQLDCVFFEKAKTLH